MNPTILYFHHVGAGIDHYTSVSLDTFRRMLDVVQRAAPIVDLADEIAGRHASGPRFILTFDDGYADLFGAVTDELQGRGVSATFFVVPAWAGGRARHPWAPSKLLCADAETLRWAQTLGFRIASHSWNHARLDQIPPADVADEVARADEWLAEESLGAPLKNVLAYPYGRLPKIPLSTIRAGFSTGRSPRACWECRPNDISREFLRSGDDENWERALNEWFRRAQHARAQCGHSNGRQVGEHRNDVT